MAARSNSIALTTDKSPAAGGMLSRRRMMCGTVAATVALAPVKSIAAPDENPHLVALGAELVEIVAALAVVEAERRAVAETWGDRWPLAPDQITFEGPRSYAEVERDLLGLPIVRAGEEKARGILDADYLRADLAALDEDINRTRSARRQAAFQREAAGLNDTLNEVEIYRVTCRGVALDSGMFKLDERAADLNSRLAAICKSIEAEPARGLAGLRIKARAVVDGPVQFLAALALAEAIVGLDAAA